MKFAINCLDQLESYINSSRFSLKEILMSLHYALIRPYINYNKEIWLGASEYMLDKVRILLKKSLKAIFNLPYNDQTYFFFKANLILKLDVPYKFNLSVSIFNYFNNETNHRDFILLFKTMLLSKLFQFIFFF